MEGNVMIETTTARYRVADGEVGANVLKLLSKVSSDDVKSGAPAGREKSLLQV
jgi:hypothetical protein